MALRRVLMTTLCTPVSTEPHVIRAGEPPATFPPSQTSSVSFATVPTGRLIPISIRQSVASSFTIGGIGARTCAFPRFLEKLGIFLRVIASAEREIIGQ